MPVIAPTSLQGSAVATKLVGILLLGATDIFAFNPSKNPVLILENPAANMARTPNIDGDSGTVVSCAGIVNVDVSAGITLDSIAVGTTVAILLSTISAYLQGVITITGADGINAQILEF